MTLNYNIKNFLNEIKSSSLLENIFLIIPILLVTGPFLPDLALVTLTIVGLYKYKKKVFDQILEHKLILIILIFSIYNIFNSFLSEEFLVSFKSSITYLRFPLFAIIAGILLANNKKIFQNFNLIITFLLFFLSIDAIFQFIFGVNLFGFESIQKNRISGVFGEEYILGSYLSRLLPIYLFLNYINNNYNFNLNNISILLIILVFIAVFISGERTSLLILCSCILISFLLVRDKNYRVFLKKFFLIALSLTLIILVFSKDLRERYVYLTFGQLFDLNIGNLKKEDVRNQNLSHIKVSYSMFKDSFIRGYGNKMFGHKCFKDYFENDGRCSTHPHNFSAQILVETGVIGFLIYLLFITILIREIIKNRNSSKCANVIILTLILINFFPLFPSGNFFNNWLNILFYLPISFYISVRNDFNNNIRNS